MNTLFSKLAVTLGAAALVVACNDNSLTDLNQSTESVTFTPQITSRVSGGVFDGGDQIRVEVNDASTIYSYLDGKFSSTTPLTTNGSDATYLAVYPEMREYLASAFSFSASNNQQSDESYESSDLLVAKATSSESNVELKFSHAMSNIELKVVDQDGEPLEDAEVEFNLATEASIDIQNGSYIAATGATKSAVKPYASGNTFNVIAAPQTIGASETIATISYNGSDDYQWQFDKANTLESGLKYKYTATLDLDSSGDITDVKITFNGLINEWNKGVWGEDVDSGDTSDPDKTPVLGEDYTLSEGLLITPSIVMEKFGLAFVDDEKRISIEDWTMDDGLVVTGAKGEHKTIAPCLWNGTHIDIRIYTGNTFTIANSSKKIAKIKFETTHSYLLAEGYANNEWIGYSNSVTFGTSEATYLEGFTVYYAEDIVK